MDGKRALVTAAGRGIGRATAAALAESGAAVVICDIDPESIADLSDIQGNCTGIVADVARPDEVKMLFDRACSSLGGLDILVNNAGIAGARGPVESIEPADLARTLEVNLQSQFSCCREAIPQLRQAGGGSIINISSVAGRLGYANRSAYSASKWGVIGLTKSLAIELGPTNVRVNAICPGAVEGDPMERAIVARAQAEGLNASQFRAKLERQASLGTMVRPEDVAWMIVFLASDLASRVSGQVISVDGNTTALV